MGGEGGYYERAAPAAWMTGAYGGSNSLGGNCGTGGGRGDGARKQ